MKRKIILFLGAAILVCADQITKALTRALIPLGARITVIPHLFGLTYVRNTGAAFSSFSGGTILLAILSLAASVVLVIALWREWLHHPFGQWILAVLLAGAFGNFIDRAFVGYVTDMVDTLFMNFAVYNLADICVVLGAIALVIYVIFFYERLEHPEARHKDKGRHE